MRVSTAFRSLFLLGGLLTGIAATFPVGVANAHVDAPSDKVGVYRVRLDNVTIKAFAPNTILGDPNPDLIIKTYTQAFDHEGQNAVFGQFDDFGAGLDWPQTKGIGQLIYLHVDCEPSENLQLIVDIYDVDAGGPGDLVKKLLQIGGGIITAKNPALGGAAGATAEAVAAAITGELNKEGRFPQWYSGSIPGAPNPFHFPDNGKLRRIALSDILPAPPDRDFEAFVTFSYMTREVECDEAGLGIQQVIEELRTNDPEVQDFFERLGDDDDDGQTNQTEQALGSDPENGASLPEHQVALDAGVCGDLIDNDGDGQTDGADAGCVVADADLDGVSDDIDNCPGVANTNQQNGDADGFGNACDAQPTIPAVAAGVPYEFQVILGPVFPSFGVLLFGAAGLGGIIAILRRRSAA